MFSAISLFAVIIPLLQLVLMVLGIYVLIVFLKALQIYIRNNG